MGTRPLIIFFVIPFMLVGCSRQRDKGGSVAHALFREVQPSASGIQFSNRLFESDTANSIFYEYYYNGAGLGIGDLNNDGLSDLVFGANMTECRVYLNRGELTFKDITGSSGINTSGKWITGVCLVDINQDGWLDIYLSAAGNINYDYRNLLYVSNGKAEDLAFTECAESVGLADDGYTTQAEFFDYDLDGDLDVYLVTAAMTIPNKNAIRPRANDGSMLNTDRLYRNEGPDPESGLPVFKNVSLEAGVSWDGFGLGAAVLDINRDGWPDIYVGNDYISNDLLYVNQGNGTFKEMAADYMKHMTNSTMGVDAADFNNDGLVDVLTLDMQPEDYFRKRIMAMNMRTYDRYMAELSAGYAPQFIWNMLQMNHGLIEGRYRFSEIGMLAGISETDWSWAPQLADFDNDGYRDLFIGNGIGHDMTNMDFSSLWLRMRKEYPDMDFSVAYKILKEDLDKRGNVKKPNAIFRNSHGLVFENKTVEWGLGKPSYSTGSAFSDLDNDGDLDLVLNNINDYAAVYENRTITGDKENTEHHFLIIQLSGDSLNRGGIGTKITLFCRDKLLYYEHFPVRGFQSMVDPRIHFGLGGEKNIDSMLVVWPDWKEQTLYNVPADQILSVCHGEASEVPPGEKSVPQGKKLFESCTADLKISFVHEERKFIDFNVQPLLPHMYSQEGPGIAVGDVNSDGMDDFYVGGSTGFPGKIFIQGSDGSFSASQLPGSNNYEDMGALFFDAEGDGDMDLYVVSGGSGLPPGNPFYADRLYVNDGRGNFLLGTGALPDNRVCGSQVTACDYDRDNDLDLFVCGRVDIENYPSPPGSFLLRNDSKGNTILFTDVTNRACPDLEKPGLIAASLWTDFDRDGWTDLVLAGEWMPVTFFRNTGGKFVNVTEETGLENYTGWWNSLAAGDFDRDGDMDYVAGNLGRNTGYRVSQEEPMTVMAKDFDNNGIIDPVCSYYVQGASYPLYHRDPLIQQIPSLRSRFNTYEDYGRATMEDIFPQEARTGAYIRDMRHAETSVLENTGNGTFNLRPLPLDAQVAPVFGLLTDDFNADGNMDILLAGNCYSLRVSDGQMDALLGLFLKGDGRGAFTPVLPRESGFFADGDTKGMAQLSLGDGHCLILVARNADSLKVLRSNDASSEIIRLGPEDVSAEITYSNGETEYREFYYGSGYLSQSSRICRVYPGTVSIKITGFSGETRVIPVKAH